MYYLNTSAAAPSSSASRFESKPLCPADRMMIETRCRRLPSAQSSRDIIRLLAEIDRLSAASGDPSRARESSLHERNSVAW